MDRTLKRDYAALAFFFLRHPSRPNAPRPVAKRGRVAGSGTLEMGGVNVTDTPLPGAEVVGRSLRLANAELLEVLENINKVQHVTFGDTLKPPKY